MDGQMDGWANIQIQNKKCINVLPKLFYLSPKPADSVKTVRVIQSESIYRKSLQDSSF